MITILGRIPIRIYPFFWMMIFILGWLNSLSVSGTLLWAGVIFFSVLLHEYGHALTAIAFGQQAQIELIGLGGVTHRHGNKLPLWKEFIIVLNGPLVSLLLAAGAYVLRETVIDRSSSNWFTYLVSITLYANLFWTIVNLLPVHPLDGGRLFSIILEGMFGVKGVRAALILGCIFAVAISVFFFAIGALLVGSIFLLLAFEGYRAWQANVAMSPEDHDNTLQTAFKEAEESLKFGNKEISLKKFEEIRQRSKSGILFVAASEHVAELMSEQNLINEPYEILVPIQRQLSPDGLRLFHQLAFRRGDCKHAAEIGNRAYQVYPNFDTAFINALCYAKMEEIRPAIGWLQRAIDDGLPKISEALQRKEFDTLRSNKLFQELVNQNVDLPSRS